MVTGPRPRVPCGPLQFPPSDFAFIIIHVLASHSRSFAIVTGPLPQTGESPALVFPLTVLGRSARHVPSCLLGKLTEGWRPLSARLRSCSVKPACPHLNTSKLMLIRKTTSVDTSQHAVSWLVAHL